MTELKERHEFLHPVTGEILAATPENAATLLGQLRDLRGRVQDVIRDVEAFIVQESERQGTKTLHLGGVKAVVRGGPETVYDLETLRQLLDLGLPEARWNELVRTTITEDVRANVAKQLEAANPEYAKVVRASRTVVEKPRRVTVSG